MGNLIMMVVPKTHMVDLDDRKYYKFRISLLLANYCVLDIGYYLNQRKNNKGKPYWLRWVCPMMGLVFILVQKLKVCCGKLRWFGEIRETTETCLGGIMLG